MVVFGWHKFGRMFVNFCDIDFMLNSPSTEAEYTASSESLPQQRSRIISKVLSPALKLWLRSQVDLVDDLQLNIEGGDRQILSGYIPKVSLSASRAVYQGLHFQQIQLIAENIRVNFGQVIKGKPLRLLEPIRAQGELLLEEADLNASLNSDLLIGGLTEFLLILLQTAGVKNASQVLKNQPILWQEITLDANQVNLRGTLLDNAHQDTGSPILVRTGAKILNGNQLHLSSPQVEGNLGLDLASLNSFHLDLGSDVDIHQLTMNHGELICRGSILLSSD